MTNPIWEAGDWTPLPRLEGPTRADVCVIGLGGSGLGALEALAARGVSAIGIDAHAVGAGAAGRNAGFVLAGLADFFHEAVDEFGPELATSLYRHTVDEAARLAAKFPDNVRVTGSLRLAASDEEKGDCQRHLTALQKQGFQAEPYSGPEGEGLLIPTDGVMQPLRRVRALATRLAARGVRLYENTPVRSVSPGMVMTEAGMVSCRAVIGAVDGRLEKLFPELAPRVRTARLQMLATAPAPEVAFPRPVYWRYGYEYWRQLPNDAIALGGFRDQAGDGEWTTDSEPDARVQGMLEKFLREHLHVKAPVTRRWAASVAYTADRLPVLEEVKKGVFAVGAYSGTGNVVGALCGRAAAALAVGEKSDWADLLCAARAARAKSVPVASPASA
jgi:gamma-glutamylputrescine oxidase